MKIYEKLSRAELKTVKGGVFNDKCAGKASTTWCRDANDKDLGSKDGTGCASFMNNCSAWPDAVAAYSTCTCNAS